VGLEIWFADATDRDSFPELTAPFESCGRRSDSMSRELLKISIPRTAKVFVLDDDRERVTWFKKRLSDAVSSPKLHALKASSLTKPL
jgi:hypothetical protein